MYILNRTDRKYFLKFSDEHVQLIIKRFLRFLRKKSTSLGVRRIYEKKSNGKMRPIGAPDTATKMVYNTITEFLTL